MINSLVGARHTVLAVLGTVLALSLSTPAHAAGVQAAAATPDGSVTLEVLAVNGSGCAPGPGKAVVSGNRDKSGFRIKYPDFVAEAGGTADPVDRRKNCQVSVQITVPEGWTFAVAQAEYRGRARLYSGATALQRTNYYWQGSSENNRTEESFAGPLSGFWDTRDVAPVLVYSPCGEQRVLNINTELRVDPGTSTSKSSMSMKASEGDVDTLFNFNWAQC